MRILLDESLPSELKREISGHDAKSNRIEDFRAVAPEFLACLENLAERTLIRIGD